ncbi:ParB/RepB/Spo0J family partition protein [Roseococcus pinisoli]|uniref:ParB-like nuclease domain-containing protein n=1 Tax=Roseococcus pinisoli TaxID=2835040 RepID=A0ABS5QFC3_9PROT|nr:ParB/RepB/Spo0J family partition protein [Roseococcus pinisoli]MBS7812376.1 ParB-like nuclease domain-containing protein [Roseococcus pinisoli]
MSAQTKTDSIVRLDKVPLSLMVPDEDNPNRMPARAFDLLVDNLERTGFTDPVLLRPFDLPAFEALRAKAAGDTAKLLALVEHAQCRFKIVGGHHRREGALYLGFDKGPGTIIVDPEFDDEAAAFQMVRMNSIRGKMDPEAFVRMYQKVQAKYADEILQDMFGFAERAEFEKLVKSTAKGLPKEMKDKFLEGAKEVKTIDGLAKLLNDLFTRYGDTAPYAFMVLDYGGQQHVWVQVSKATMKSLRTIGEICITEGRTMDSILGKFVQAVANNEFPDFLKAAIESTPHVVLPANMPVAPTLKNLETMNALD